MTELSATATAILKAYEDSPWEYHNADFTAIAAVLRAVIDEVSLSDSAKENLQVLIDELEEEASKISL